MSRGVKRRSALAGIISFHTSSGPLRYLGLPLDTGYHKAKSYAPLVDRCRDRISRWVSHLLSTARLIELVRSVIHYCLVYWW